jgi:sodium-dependent phosphate cotransporter
MITSFGQMGKEVVEQIIYVTANPFISFFIGLLATALMHSSSTITTAIVAMVAAQAISIENAVFMVIGANIGTTVTSTMVAMGHVTQKTAFKRAIAVATLHDFFNILTAIALFPLEYYFKFLSRLAVRLSYWLPHFSTEKSTIFFDPFEVIYLTLNAYLSNIGGLLLAILLLFFSIRRIALLTKTVFTLESATVLSRYLSGSPLKELFSGILITGLVQSSTVVSSLIVPLAASKKFTTQRIFPFLLGANVGTTLTALIASLTSSQAAQSIALTHVLFNVLGVLIFFPIKAMRRVPVYLAMKMGALTLKNRLVGITYISLVFFVMPFLLIYASKDDILVKEYTYASIIEIPDTAIGFWTMRGTTSQAHRKLTYRKETFAKQALREDPMFQSPIQINWQSGMFWINQQVFFLADANECWDGEDELGKYQMCVEQVALLPKKPFIFLKKYVSHQKAPAYIRYYIDMHQKIILKTEFYDDNFQLLSRWVVLGLL